MGLTKDTGLGAGPYTLDNDVTINGDLLVEGGSTSIFTTVLEVEDKNILVNVGGTAGTAEGAGLTVSASGGDLASIQYDSTLDSKFKVGVLGSELPVLTSDKVSISSAGLISSNNPDGVNTLTIGTGQTGGAGYAQVDFVSNAVRKSTIGTYPNGGFALFMKGDNNNLHNFIIYTNEKVEISSVDTQSTIFTSKVAGGGVSKSNILVINGDSTSEFNAEHDHASGAVVGLSVLSNHSTTGTASATDLLINRTETSAGSGSQYLMDAQVDDVSKFSVSNEGVVTVAGDLILPKTTSTGIKVDATTPTFGWRDLRAEIRTRGVGGTDPNDGIYIGNIRAYNFSVNDEAWIEFHVPHDYVAGTDIHLHFHWSHNSAIVTGGSITLEANVTYAKGHDQAAFLAEITTTLSPNASTTQYQHMVSEVQLSASSPSASQIDTDDLEPDGLILARVYLSANNITSGGAVPDPFIHEVDVHYQSTNIATKDKEPDFYT